MIIKRGTAVINKVFEDKCEAEEEFDSETIKTSEDKFIKTDKKEILVKKSESN